MRLKMKQAHNERRSLRLLFMTVAASLVLFVLVLNAASDSSQRFSREAHPFGLEEINEVVEDCGTYLNEDSLVKNLPIIYFVTPTYSRPVQIPELIRTGQTLLLAKNIHWIVVEDAPKCSEIVRRHLKELGIPHTHLASATPSSYKTASIKPRGVSGRRAALSWVKKNAKIDGVLYFGDDDNTYHRRVFDEIRNTKNVSVFPVGLVPDFLLSTPIVKEGKIIGFYDPWVVDRLFPVDMAGFAVSVRQIRDHPDSNIPFIAGYEEDRFIQSLGVIYDDLEPKASNCTEILVWHTQTVQVTPGNLKKTERLDIYNLKTLMAQLEHSGDVLWSTSGKQAKIYWTSGTPEHDDQVKNCNFFHCV